MSKLINVWILGLVFSYGSAGWSASVEVVEPWVRLMPKTAPATGVFMEIKNTTDKDVKVVKASSSWAKTVELHDHILENGVYKMRPIPGIDIKKGSTAVLKPGSLHVMLIGLTKELKTTESVDVQLTLDNNETVTFVAPVKEMSGMGRGKKRM